MTKLSKNKNIVKAKAKLSRAGNRAVLKMKKNSPEILLGLGILGFIGAAASMWTAKERFEDVLDFHEERLKQIKEAHEVYEEDPENELEYDEKMYREDLAKTYAMTSLKMAKVFAPTVVLAGLSVAALVSSRNIAHRRYLGLMSAYNSLSLVFDEYRQRVREEAGELMDRHYRYGTVIDTINETEISEDGKKHKVKKQIENLNIDEEKMKNLGGTAFLFHEGNVNWSPSPNVSLAFLRGQENYFNMMLSSRGHVFLNEVYDAIGAPRTSYGAVLGWLDDDSETSYVDFGLRDQHKETVRRFINGTDSSILLDFNHMGPIWDKI